MKSSRLSVFFSHFADSVPLHAIVVVAVICSLLIGQNNELVGQPQILHKITKMPDPKRIAEDQLAKYLGGELPLKLDANSTYPTVDDAELPGGTFQGRPLELTLDSLIDHMPLGDHLINVTPECSEWSVHQGGRGIEYRLAPVQGKLGTVISTLLWRGAFAGLPISRVQAVSWAIQSGLPYAKMPPPYQKTIDQLLPDFKSRLQGNYLDALHNKYSETGKSAVIVGNLGAALHLPGARSLAKLPPLDEELGKMGSVGQSALEAEQLQKTILANYQTDQEREAVLYQGQGTPLPPQPAANGAWTVAVPNVAYMRFKVGSGNLSPNNTLEIRILPSSKSIAAFSPISSRLVRAAYQRPVMGNQAAGAPSLLEMMGVNVNRAAFAEALAALGEAGAAAVAADLALPILILLALAITAEGIIGYSRGAAAQALILTLPGPFLMAVILATIRAANRARANANNAAGTRPCKLVDGTIVPVGTIAYREDVLPPNVLQHGIYGSHLNLYVALQNPANGWCHWQGAETVPPPPQAGWIPIQEFDNIGR